MLATVVRSHGWYGLPPLRWDEDAGVFSFAYALRSDTPVTVRVRQVGDRLRGTAEATTPLSRADVDDVKATVRRCLRLDEDLAEFYAMTAADERYAWVNVVGAGRILRAPTPYEDLVKILCTTNCSWALTESMVGKLVDRLGFDAPGGYRSFPTAAAMARKRPAFYRDVIRAGYRADYMAKISRAVARGDVNPDAWSSASDADGLRAELLALPGIGPYAAAHLLRLSGHYDDHGIDSWVREKHRRMYGLKRPPKDAAIVRKYRGFGRFAGLALWMDHTRDWHVPGSDER